MSNQSLKKIKPLPQSPDAEIQVEEFSLKNLSPAERKQAETMSGAICAIMLKGLLNRADPARYPVIADAASSENQAAALARTIDMQAFERMRPRLLAFVGDQVRLKRILGPHHKIDFHKAGLDAALKDALPRGGSAPEGEAVRRSGHKYNRAHLILRALHCVDETNPEGGTDDMVLGGVLIGASGNVKAFNSLVCGEFDDGTYRNFGELFLGQYSLNTTPGYPKHLYAIFKLVESDSDDREVAQQLTQVLSMLASTILSAVASPLVGSTVGAVLGAVGGFISNLLDEDEFPPYGIRITLTSENHFGGAVSPKFRTGNISGHGGTYRIGLRMMLAP